MHFDGPALQLSDLLYHCHRIRAVQAITVQSQQCMKDKLTHKISLLPAPGSDSSSVPVRSIYLLAALCGRDGTLQHSFAACIMTQQQCLR